MEPVSSSELVNSSCLIIRLSRAQRSEVQGLGLRIWGLGVAVVEVCCLGQIRKLTIAPPRNKVRSSLAEAAQFLRIQFHRVQFRMQGFVSKVDGDKQAASICRSARASYGENINKISATCACMHIHTYIHTYIYIYIYTYARV